MTPSRVAIMWATPRCQTRRMIRDGQHGVHFTCLQSMRYVQGEWRCPDCGTTTLRATLQEAA